MTSVAQPICMSCSRLRPASSKFSCDAYPGGIPEAIISSDVDHRKPYAGDGGKQFIQDPGKPQPTT